MLNEVQTYIDAIKRYDEDAASIEHTFWEKYNAAAGERRARREALAKPDAQPLKDSGDKLVAWVAEFVLPHYPTEGLAVLKALPATLDELTVLAHNRGWCTTFDHFVAAAREAGVFATEAPAEVAE